MNEKRKRIKWEPAALMALVLGLGLWIAFGPASKPSIPVRDGAITLQYRVDSVRGVLEAAPDPETGELTIRFLSASSPSPRGLTLEEAKGIYPPEIIRNLTTPRKNRVFSLLNITSWVGVVWLGIGLLGQLLFSGRMVLQWITSERKRQSVITESFWWFSLGGSLLLFSYFVWRQDPVALLGQASGIVIYARNLRLIYKRRRRDARRAAGESAGATVAA
ncbi:MAG: lipid-A-disaccharide synthase N-terminal domain-containing protein [Phycisphaerales bacterium]